MKKSPQGSLGPCWNGKEKYMQTCSEDLFGSLFTRSRSIAAEASPLFTVCLFFIGVHDCSRNFALMQKGPKTERSEIMGTYKKINNRRIKSRQKKPSALRAILPARFSVWPLRFLIIVDVGSNAFLPSAEQLRKKIRKNQPV